MKKIIVMYIALVGLAYTSTYFAAGAPRRNSCPSPEFFYRNDLHPRQPRARITSMTAHSLTWSPEHWQQQLVQRAAQLPILAASRTAAPELEVKMKHLSVEESKK